MKGASIQRAWLSLTSAETEGWESHHNVTGFGSCDSNTCKSIVDLLESGDLRLGQVVIESCSSRAWSEQWKWRSAISILVTSDHYNSFRVLFDKSASTVARHK